MEISNLIPHVESLVFASDKPLTSLELTELINNAFGFMEDKVTLDKIESSIEAIAEKYQSEFYPFEIRQSGGGWQFLTKKEFHKTVAQLNGEKFLKRLSSASLETLSIIAYKQPVTKAEIESIRGVSSDYAVQKLLEKELIVITGRNEALPGHPLVYATSKSFMDYFGINSPEDLPKLKEVYDDSMVNATQLSDIVAEQATEELEEESSSVLLVSETGELVIEPINDLHPQDVDMDETIPAEDNDTVEHESEPGIEDEPPTNETDVDRDEDVNDEDRDPNT